MSKEYNTPALSELWHCERGSFAILTAFSLPCMIAAAALAVDVGSLYVERRDAQGATDLAAILAAANLDNAEAVANATLAANNVNNISHIDVIKGVYTPDPAMPYDQRFTPGATPYNAVKVVTTKTGQTFFGRALGVVDPAMSVNALGVSSAEATFSLGSRLLSVHDGIPNMLLGALLGGNVNLSVMDYNALLNANVETGTFLRALAAQLHVTVGTYNDVLASNASVGTVLQASAVALSASGNSGGAAALNALLAQSSAASLKLPLQSLIDLGTLGSLAIEQTDPGLGAMLNVLDMVNASAALANANHQVQVDLTASVSGVLSLKLDLAVGERMQHSPWVRVGQPGATLYTAQTRLRLVAQVGGTGLLAGTTIRLPIALDVAYAQGTLSAVTCPARSSQNANVDIAVTPGIAKAWIGELSTNSLVELSANPVVGPAKIVSTSALSVTGSAFAMVGDQAPVTVSFDSSDIASNIVKTVDTSNFSQSLVTSLLGKLSVSISTAGLQVTSSALVQSAVAASLAPVARSLDSAVYTLLTALGVHLGEADVRVDGARCGCSTLSG